jgi:hypothetical protein
MQWVSSVVVGVLVATAGACSSDTSTNSGRVGEAGTAGSEPATGGGAGDKGEGTGGSAQVIAGAGGTAAGTGGTAAGTGGAVAGTGGATGGSAGTGGATGGSAGTGGATGGSASGGGTTITGGALSTGGQSATGGTAASGGTAGLATGGAASGGTATGGGSSTGGTAGTTPCVAFGSPTVVGQIASSALSELSGLAASRAQAGILYGHADSGSAAMFVAMDSEGQTLGTYTLSGVTATDWEDIAVGRAPDDSDAVFIADIGDNAARTGSGTPRGEIQVYRIAEPVVSTAQAAVDATLSGAARLRFTYPDQAQDAEALMIDPVTGDLLIVTKETSGASQVFRAPGSTPVDTPTVLESIATLALGTSGAQSALVTAGDISPSGDRVILRTYSAIWLWTRAVGTTLASTFADIPFELPSPSEPQGEGLTFSADGFSWYAAGEQESALYQGTCSSST